MRNQKPWRMIRGLIPVTWETCIGRAGNSTLAYSVTYDGPAKGYSAHLRSMRKRAILERKEQHIVYD